jgi:hypothetical protein
MTTVRVVATGLVAAVVVVHVVGGDWAYRGSGSVAERLLADVRSRFSQATQQMDPKTTDEALAPLAPLSAQVMPRTIQQGKAFDFAGLHYNGGWRLVPSANGKLTVELKARNAGDRRATHGFEMTLTRSGNVMASAGCITALLPPKRTGAVKCGSGNSWPVAYDEITIHETF